MGEGGDEGGGTGGIGSEGGGGGAAGAAAAGTGVGGIGSEGGGGGAAGAAAAGTGVGGIGSEGGGGGPSGSDSASTGVGGIGSEGGGGGPSGSDSAGTGVGGIGSEGGGGLGAVGISGPASESTSGESIGTAALAAQADAQAAMAAIAAQLGIATPGPSQAEISAAMTGLGLFGIAPSQTGIPGTALAGPAPPTGPVSMGFDLGFSHSPPGVVGVPAQGPAVGPGPAMGFDLGFSPGPAVALPSQDTTTAEEDAAALSQANKDAIALGFMTAEGLPGPNAQQSTNPADFGLTDVPGPTMATPAEAAANLSVALGNPPSTPSGKGGIGSDATAAADAAIAATPAAIPGVAPGTALPGSFSLSETSEPAVATPNPSFPAVVSEPTEPTTETPTAPLNFEQTAINNAQMSLAIALDQAQAALNQPSPPNPPPAQQETLTSQDIAIGPVAPFTAPPAPQTAMINTPFTENPTPVTTIAISPTPQAPVPTQQQMQEAKQALAEQMNQQFAQPQAPLTSLPPAMQEAPPTTPVPTQQQMQEAKQALAEQMNQQFAQPQTPVTSLPPALGIVAPPPQQEEPFSPPPIVAIPPPTPHLPQDVVAPPPLAPPQQQAKLPSEIPTPPVPTQQQLDQAKQDLAKQLQEQFPQPPPPPPPPPPESKTAQQLADEASKQAKSLVDAPPPAVVTAPPAVVAQPPAPVAPTAPTVTAAPPAATPGQNLGFAPGSNLAGFGSFGAGNGRLVSEFGNNITQMTQVAASQQQQPAMNLRGVNPGMIDRSLWPLWWQQNVA